MHKRIKKFCRKKFKKVKEKELPSFLLDLEIDDNKILLRKKDSDVYLGPVFFGCKQYHPPFYLPNLADSHQPHYTATYKENTLKGVFRSKPVTEKHEEVKKSFHPVIKRKKFFTDLYPHKCPGNKKVFKPMVAPRILDLGETKSIIEGEKSWEIPLYWLKKVSSGAVEAKFELVTLSDIRERKRALLPYKERIAHTHFPKEFINVRVIGPTIPAALTITKICSKRKYEVEMVDHVQSETVITEKKTSKKTEKEVKNGVTEEAEFDSPAEILQSEEENKEEVKSVEASTFGEDEQSEQCLSEMSFEEVDEEKEGSIIFSEEAEQDEENLENEESEIEN